MSDLETLYLIVGGAGLVLLIISLALGELELGGDFPEIDIDSDVDLTPGTVPSMPGWSNAQILMTALAGFGGSGFISAYIGVPDALTPLMGLGGAAALAAGTLYLVFRPLARRQGNSMISRSTYVGRVGKLIVPATAEMSGQIRFIDNNGSWVTQSARSAVNDSINTDTECVIVEVQPDFVLVTPLNLDPYS